MALNFPSNTDLPYVDPVSGLKYIYNKSVGAWESAIQPPAIVSSTAPDLTIPGFLWWDDVGGSLYVYYKDANSEQWVEAVPTGDDIRRVGIAETAPPGALEGDMWWDSINGRLYIYYKDADSSQWIDASPNTGGGSGGGDSTNTRVFQGTTPPPDPQENDLWFDSNQGNLNIYYTDPDSSQWVICQNFTGGGQSGGVASVTGTAPIIVAGNSRTPVISIGASTTTSTGSIRIADQTETNAANDTTIALTPGTLKGALDITALNYIPSASPTRHGVLQTATQAEVEAGTDGATAVTPLSLKQALPAIGLGVPTGTVISFAGSTPPTGYLNCDGTAVSRTLYPTLFSICGTTYGIGNGTTTFNLPDLRGEFVRGWDQGKGSDSGRQFGSFQSDDMKSHQHTGSSGPAGSSPTNPGGGQRTGDTGQYTTNFYPASSTETRPRNIALLYCIKS